MEHKYKLLKSLIFSIYQNKYSDHEIDQTIKNIFKIIKKNKKSYKTLKKK